MKHTRFYSELILLPTFEERFEYLKLEGSVGKETFGYNRYLNQILYRSYEWRKFRRQIILRDNGCDLGLPGYDICDTIFVHHINPITEEDVELDHPDIYNPEFVICTRGITHNAIHYSNIDIIPKEEPDREINDTIPWR